MQTRSVALVTALVAAASACGERPAATPRPNVVILFTDDQRYNTIAALGNDELRTPSMDRLASMGTTFTRAFVMGGHHGAICAPSRAMLLTGRPLFDLHETGDIIPERHAMMPTAFAEAGYVTFFTGKWHNNRSAFVRAFRQGDNIFFGGMHFPSDGGHEAPWLFHFDPTGQYPDSARWQGHGFSSQLFADAVMAFLRERRKGEEPFFAYVAFTSPHDPRTPPSPYRDWYSAESVSLPSNFLPEHPFDNGELHVRDEMLLPHPRTEHAVRQEIAAYYGMISEVDAQIGRILDALAENGQLDNTIVVLAGDNGLALGSHGLLGKQSVYDHSVRVPLIIAGPGIPRGETREALAYLFDVFPTLAALTGVTRHRTVLGENLVPVLQDPRTRLRSTAYFAYRDLQRAVRTEDDWKLIRYDVDGSRHTQLFDLGTDPFERHNLADDPTHAVRRTQLEELMAGLRRSYHDPLDLAAPDWGKSARARPTSVDHLALGARVTVAHPFSTRYLGHGPGGLSDGIRCPVDHALDCWQALEEADLEATIDLGVTRSVSAIEATFLRNVRAWIFVPVHLDVSLSLDGVSYESVATRTTPAATEDDPTEVVAVSTRFEPQPARYVRVHARSQGTCPGWHSGAGGKAWLFVDEIVVR